VVAIQLPSKQSGGDPQHLSVGGLRVFVQLVGHRPLLQMNNQLIKPNSIKDLVVSEGVKNRLKEIMGDRGNAFGAALVQIVKQTYALQKCTAESVMGAALTAASLDLSVDPNLGEAHLIPYGDQCQFQVGFKGFIQLAMRSGEYKAFGSTIVREGELKVYDELTGELELETKKNPTGKVIGYAAKFKLLNGFERGEFWTCEEIEAHALQYSKSYRFCKGKPDKEKDCLWVTKRDEMAIKTVEKSLLNHYGPKSVQMKRAVVMDGGAIVNADTGELEYIDSPSGSKVSSPEFKDAPGSSATHEPSPEPAQPVKAAPAKPQEAPAVAQKPTLTAKERAIPSEPKVTALVKRIVDHGITVAQVLDFLTTLGVIDANVSTIDMLYVYSTETFNMLSDQLDDIAARIRGN
jgi:recombination protein RecT